MTDPFNALAAFRALLDGGCNLPVGPRVVALALVRHADGNGECFPSLETLAADTGLSRRTVARALDAIVDDPTAPVRVVRQRRGRADGDGGRASNVYRVRLDLSATVTLKGVLECQPGTQPGGDLSANGAGVECQIGGGLSAMVALEGTHLTTHLTTQEGKLATERSEIGNERKPETTAPRALGTAPNAVGTAPLALGIDDHQPKPTRDPGSPTGAKQRSNGGKRKPETPIPEGFEPSAAVFDMASKELGFDAARVRSELAKFKDHAAETDRRARDWTAAFRRWLRNAKSWEKAPATERTAPNYKPVRFGDEDDAARFAELKKANGERDARNARRLERVAAATGAGK